MLEQAMAAWAASEPVVVADTPTSRVLRVRLASGGTAVIKDLKPIGTQEELRGADLLAWRDGAGYVRLLAREGATLLLEDAGDRSLLGHLADHGDDAANIIAADALRAMHAPLEAPAPTSALQPLADSFGSLLAMAEVGTRPLFEEAAAVARELLGEQRDVRPIHGDFHHENLLHADRGWLAIDPKGLVGDPAYDVANLFSNPLDRDDLRLDPAKIRARAAILAPAVERDERTILRWAFAHACLSASWHLEDGHRAEAERSLGVAAAVRRVLLPDG